MRDQPFQNRGNWQPTARPRRRGAGWAASIPAIALLLLPGCDPTDTPPGGNPTTDCTVPSDQPSSGLRIECRITGGLPNAKIDPANAASDACGPLTFNLFDQSINVPIEIIYGENGEDTPGRVRLGATITSATQSGKLVKAAGDRCTGKTGPEFDVNTSFEGKHIALVDKEKNPACVYESRLQFDSYEQTVGVGLDVPIGDATRQKVRLELARRLDLEMARTANSQARPRANPNTSDFISRAGRCENDYRRFTGN